MSVFTALPQDMLQWEINRFLDPLSRLQWNEVLKKDERVYKKFPKDYAIKHQIRLSSVNLWKIDSFLCETQDLREPPEDISIEEAVKELKAYFNWYKDPKNHLVVMYIEGFKEESLEEIRKWSQFDELYFEFWDDEFLDSNDLGLELRNEALDLLNLVSDIPFIRNIPMNRLEGYKSAFE
jgi:hypothetical protein